MSFASGIALQANETGIVPTVAQILPFLPKDKTRLFTLRDTMGWHEGEKVLGQYALTPTWQALVTLVQALRTIGYNARLIATLYGGNPLYSNMKSGDIPSANIVGEIEGFTNWAAWAVKTPNLFAVSIWNEMDGQTNGGVAKVPARQLALANLTMACIPVIRTANPTVKIIVGASEGKNIDGWFINMGKVGMDYTKADYLDVHPYISTALGAAIWENQLAIIRKAGIVLPLWLTEWGGPAAVDYGPVYPSSFLKNIVAADTVPVAGGNYFTLQDSAKFPKQGLLDATNTITSIGTDYIAAFAA